MEMTINTFLFQGIKVREFTNLDPDVSGVEVYQNGNHLGSIVGESIPVEEDKDATAGFASMLEDWLVDNCEN